MNTDTIECPRCGRHNFLTEVSLFGWFREWKFICRDCGFADPNYRESEGEARDWVVRARIWPREFLYSFKP